MLNSVVILFPRLPKESVQKMKRAYMEWEKGNAIVFGLHINGKKSYDNYSVIISF